MEEHERTASSKALPIILIAAVVQGWALYGLHFSTEHKHWPSTDPAWLIGLYSIALFIPVTVQLLAEHLRKPLAVAMVALLGLGFFYMGWYAGDAVTRPRNIAASEDNYVALSLGMGVLWLLTLPFLQARLASGSWRLRYDMLFATAWRNKLALAEAVLFTGALWLLLMLWQSLFRLLGIGFFRDLFRQELFIYPVTSIAFGLALHLIGSVERFIATVLEQLLNVLKWLAIVAGLILALFTVALIFKLPELFVTGQRAIGAAWLLWLVAVVVLLINAAYRDGSVERPYPKWIAISLRVVVPLTTIVAFTALYALYVRTSRYGLTVERVWAFIVASAAAMYSIGYAIAAFRGGRWMNDIARVNIVVAIAMIAMISLALTPVLSPYRLAANSQAALVLGQDALDESSRDSSLKYLRFNSGQYGRNKLEELAKLDNHPRAAEIRKATAAAMAAKNEWEPLVKASAEERLDAMIVFPAGAKVDDALRQEVIAALNSHGNSTLSGKLRDEQSFGVFGDLNGDAVDEFAFLDAQQAFLFEHVQDRWAYVGTLTNNLAYARGLAEDFAAGSIGIKEPRWKTLVIGKREYRVEPMQSAVVPP